MLNADSGWINQFLSAIGISNPPDWLNDPSWIYPGLVLIGIWGIGGGIIVYLAGLRGIPTELYDAARIDGAGPWASLRHVTLPMLSPVVFYTLILSVVDLLQYFLVPLVLNQGTGEPGGTTNFLNLYIYKNFFAYQDMAYGATLAWLLRSTLVSRCCLLRSFASTTPASGRRDEVGGLRRPVTAAVPWGDRGDGPRRRREVVHFTFIGVVILAAFLALGIATLSSRARSRSPQSTTDPAGDGPDVTYRDRDYPVPGAARKRYNRWRARQERPRLEPVRRPG
jgi:hypothetical protein